MGTVAERVESFALVLVMSGVSVWVIAATMGTVAAVVLAAVLVSAVVAAVR